MEVSSCLPKNLSDEADIFLFNSKMVQTNQLPLCQKLLAIASNTYCGLQTYEIQKTFFSLLGLDMS